MDRRVKKYKKHIFGSIVIHNFRVLLMMAIPLAFMVSVLMFQQLSVSRRETITQNSVIAAKSVALIDSQLQSISDLGLSISVDKSVKLLMRTDSLVLSKQLNKRLWDVQLLLNSKITSLASIDDAVLYFDRDKFCVSESSGWHCNDLADNNPVIRVLRKMYPRENGFVFQGENLYFYQNITDSIGNSGVLLTFTRKDTLNNLMMSFFLLPGSSIVVVDQDGKRLASSDDTWDMEIILQNSNEFYKRDGMHYSITAVDSGTVPWRFYCIMPAEDYDSNYHMLLHMSIIVSVAACLLSIIVAYALARYIGKPVIHVLDLLRNPEPISQAEYEKRYRRFDELGLISTLINQSKYRTMSLEDALKTRETQLRMAQNAALQGQMNPHFLFNTLESINWQSIAQLGEDNNVSRMTGKLARLLLSSLQAFRPLVPIEEEIEHAKLYLELQQMRFCDRFRVQWRISEGVWKYAVIRLSIQPLLENSISHGLKSISNGLICVECFEDENSVIIKVTDTGKGMTAEKLACLKNQLTMSAESQTEHIGLSNLAQRIHLIFDEKGKLEIESEPMRGCTVCMYIPKVSKDKCESFIAQNIPEKGE